MQPRKRIFLLIIIMASLVVVVESITIGILYNTAFEEERLRLIETARSQARLIEAVARFDKQYSNDYPYGAQQATLTQIQDAHSQYRGFGKTSEFTLAKKENNQMVFLLAHHYSDLDKPKSIPWDSNLAVPMRLALSGKSGTVVDLDYRGEKVLAAFEPVAELNLGIVTKIDLSEIRAPFIQASFISGLFAIAIIAFGVNLFFKVTNPMIRGLNDTVEKLQKALAEVKTLKGILPICSFCKKIRDDDGYWRQLEVYLRDRSDADFSHGVCPECVKKHYPDFCPKEEESGEKAQPNT